MRFTDVMESAALDGYRHVRDLRSGEETHIAPVVSRRKWTTKDDVLFEEQPGPAKAADGLRYFTDVAGQRIFACTLSSWHGSDYPHEGACAGCREERRRNVCGGKLETATFFSGRWHCTNGRCRECHDVCCTPGGNASPGHGFGTRAVAEAQAKRSK